jgi:hypothetical protein
MIVIGGAEASTAHTVMDVMLDHPHQAFITRRDPQRLTSEMISALLDDGRSDQDISRQLGLAAKRLEHYEDRPDVTLVLAFPDGQTFAVGSIRVGAERSEIHFPDGSMIGFTAASTARVLDDGLALLEPITLTEYQAIEQLLAMLWEAAANDRLTEAQERKIRSIAEMIADEQRDTTPEETPRYRLVAVVRRGFLSGEDVLNNGVAWVAVADVFGRIGWHTIEAIARAAGG